MWYNKNHNMIFFLTTGNFILLANSMKTKTLKNMAERPMRFFKILSIEFSFVSAFLWIRNCVRFDSSKWPEFIFKSYGRTRTKAEIKWSGLNWPRSSLSIISICNYSFILARRDPSFVLPECHFAGTNFSHAIVSVHSGGMKK